MQMALNSNKSPEELLQEEFLQERAAVLGRAGDSVSKALERLKGIENSLKEHLVRLRDVERSIRQDCTDIDRMSGLRRQLMIEINKEINKFNRAREYASTRYYYLIVTREAMGLRRHHWVEQHYQVPPRKKHLQDG